LTDLIQHRAHAFVYEVQNPSGVRLGYGHEPDGIKKFLEHMVMILDDHADFKVFTASITGDNSAKVVREQTPEDFITTH
jgi:hypothetical protein